MLRGSGTVLVPIEVESTSQVIIIPLFMCVQGDSGGSIEHNRFELVEVTTNPSNLFFGLGNRITHIILIFGVAASLSCQLIGLIQDPLASLVSPRQRITEFFLKGSNLHPKDQTNQHVCKLIEQV
jgi:hypothetical protein